MSLGYRDNPAGGASVQLLMVQGTTSSKVRKVCIRADSGWRSHCEAGLADFVVNVAHRSLWPALLLTALPRWALDALN
ncbi:MAG: hypothetical protein IPM02_27590 [Betaproteobacteria bacterium]|nr:hypothetical protein [Betaproteobacteria bacterium]